MNVISKLLSRVASLNKKNDASDAPVKDEPVNAKPPDDPAPTPKNEAEPEPTPADKLKAIFDGLDNDTIKSVIESYLADMLGEDDDDASETTNSAIVLAKKNFVELSDKYKADADFVVHAFKSHFTIEQAEKEFPAYKSKRESILGTIPVKVVGNTDGSLANSVAIEKQAEADWDYVGTDEAKTIHASSLKATYGGKKNIYMIAVKTLISKNELPGTK